LFDGYLDFLKSYRENPQARVITVAYFALVRMENFKPEASSFAEKAFWQDVQNLPSLAFDHSKIVKQALEKLRHDFERDKTGFELLPEKFTLGHIQRLYEAILGENLDKRNFRKKILKEELVTSTKQKQKGVLHKPALLYTINNSL
jgi:8-oxo-dGTP diphosphatase